MSEDMPFAEGCYRLAGGEWHVVTAIRARPDERAYIKTGVKWASGVTGINIVFPSDQKINKRSLIESLSEALGIEDWREVPGPDSMALR